MGTDKKYYLYSADGIIGFVQGGQRFLYRKNLFGDITAIYQGETKLAEYEYDAWGNCTITLDTNSVGKNNPFRYRGYYWDNDIKLYYLMSRYYDPKTGRFINADTFDYLKPKAVNGLNLYAYCRNNPVMYKDPSGHEAWSEDTISDLLSGVLMIILGIIGIVAASNVSQNKGNAEGNNSFALDPDWEWIPKFEFDPPYISSDGITLINLEAIIGKASLYFDSLKSHSLYLILIDASASIESNFKENNHGFSAELNVLNFGYDGKYFDLELSVLGAGAGLGWYNGVFKAKMDPIGFWGIGVEIDIWQIAMDLSNFN